MSRFYDRQQIVYINSEINFFSCLLQLCQWGDKRMSRIAPARDPVILMHECGLSPISQNHTASSDEFRTAAETPELISHLCIQSGAWGGGLEANPVFTHAFR